METFMAWLGGLGEAVVNPSTPLGMSKAVSPDGVSEDSGADYLTGFSIIKANSMDAALEIPKACPFLDIGTVDVAEMMEMS